MSGPSNISESSVQQEHDYLAPDGSEIRLLTQMNGGGLCHCTLPVGAVSSPVYHKTVEEIWYFLSGEGEVWRRSATEENVVAVRSGTSVSIPRGTAFQFRNTGDVPLLFIDVTIPLFPGPEEAVATDGHWPTTTR